MATIQARDKAIEEAQEKDKLRLVKLGECLRVIQRCDYGLVLQRDVIRSYANGLRAITARFLSTL